jgi:hypothetical protein
MRCAPLPKIFTGGVLTLSGYLPERLGNRYHRSFLSGESADKGRNSYLLA